MSLLKVFDIAGASMTAQSVRLNTTASNLANANTAAGSAEDAYSARHPVFETVMDWESEASAGVRVSDITASDKQPTKVHQPGHPEADADGYVYMSNVNPVDELVNMISASRGYQNSIEIMNTSKELLLRTLRLGQ